MPRELPSWVWVAAVLLAVLVIGGVVLVAVRGPAQVAVQEEAPSAPIIAPGAVPRGR